MKFTGSKYRLLNLSKEADLKKATVRTDYRTQNRQHRKRQSNSGASERTILETDVVLCDYHLLQRSCYAKRRQELAALAAPRTDGFQSVPCQGCCKGICRRCSVAFWKLRCEDFFAKKQGEDMLLKAVQCGTFTFLQKPEEHSWRIFLANTECNQPWMRLGFPVLEQFLWRRVIFDEFHELNDDTCRALSCLRAHHRWGLTGTPAPCLQFRYRKRPLRKKPCLCGFGV